LLGEPHPFPAERPPPARELIASTPEVNIGFVDAETIGVAIAAIAAIASAVSASTSRLAVDRANQAFVWATISRASDGGQSLVRVRLHNEGPGVARDVRWSATTLTEVSADEWDVDDELILKNKSPLIRAMQPGESLPPEESGWLNLAFSPPEDDIWWVLVRWSDAARVRWERTEEPSELRSRTRKLRTWFWQFWRPSGKPDW
jgi:hypothetical protein